MKTMIVDDEPAAREMLAELLAKESDVEIIGSYGDPRQAVAAIRRDRPDLLFLDIRMSALDGFALLGTLGDDAPRAIVFVTAFDEHAIAAFDVSAADYVLKPLDEERLSRAVERARTRLLPDAQAARPGALAGNSAAAGYARVIPVSTRDRIILQRVDEVFWFEADGKYIRVHAPAGIYLIRHPMHGLEQRLDPTRFMRISRSAIVNVDQIHHIEPWSRGDYCVVLKSGHKVTSTEAYRARLRQLTHEV
ncbi:MAG: LytTr DNA-binding region [Gemmatimonadetes bacterium]|nr:LytTr DNA-binding region [Gemmatimonadota bacterium]